MHKCYEAIIIIETNFQNTIVEKVVKQRFAGKNYLIIDARDNKIIIEGKEYHVNLGGIKWVMRSIWDIRKLPELRTIELIGTHFTGINCRFFESYIKYEKLSLIDDGIGTPAILKGAHFVKSLDWFFRLLFANVFMITFKGRRLKTEDELIKRISFYYTIYQFVNNSYSDSLKNVKIHYLDYYSSFKELKIIHGIAGYIGSGKNPNIEKCLYYVREKHKYIIYYPHPREKVDEVIKNLVDEIIRPPITIEDYFKINGIPEFVYGNMSSTFLNLRLSGVKSKLTVFSTVDEDNAYCKIFWENNIKTINVKQLMN